MIHTLVYAHKLSSKILITTAVLDNGTSIHDPEVENVVIATESRVSFLQMLGRVRAESTNSCKLFIYPRDKDFFERRIAQFEERMLLFDSVDRLIMKSKEISVLLDGWYRSGDEADQFRNTLILSDRSTEFYSNKFKQIYLRCGDLVLTENEFAREKTGNMLLAEKEFFRLAVIDPSLVAVKQISWIGKSAEELTVISSTYKKERENQLISSLLEVQNFTKDELIKKKEAIAKEFRKDLLEHDIKTDASFGLAMLKRICKRYGLIVEQYTEAKTQRYTIKKEGDVNVAGC